MDYNRSRIVERTAFATAAPYKTPLEPSSPVTRLDTRYAYFDCTLGPIAESLSRNAARDGQSNGLNLLVY